MRIEGFPGISDPTTFGWIDAYARYWHSDRKTGLTPGVSDEASCNEKIAAVILSACS